MKMEGFKQNALTFTSVLKGIAKLGDVNEGRQAWISIYAKCGHLSDARLVFEDNFAGCDVNIALECLDIRVLSRRVLVRRCWRSSVDQAINVYNVLSDAYSKCMRMDGALKVVERMEGRDVVSWTTLIIAYAQSQECEKAMERNPFSDESRRSHSKSIHLREHSRRTCEPLLARVWATMHGILCKMGFGRHGCVESALIDVYVKCGSLVEAKKAFNKIGNPDIVSWTAIISDYDQHGLFGDAIQLFEDMEELGIKPNVVAILCILFACSHGGMVDKGHSYF
ncbi:putative pentatricopeptide repeat-containing protein [Acorus gramineus]|uniref:Pentatricopeptide repeat-containing protein n=1 Tax=Acorus gramineus TaxID=55184 RepID=A0AAV9AN84_ACOGR|nr:putative pentatricopeptide repeat-containing protein [Acorus gramineus]